MTAPAASIFVAGGEVWTPVPDWLKNAPAAARRLGCKLIDLGVRLKTRLLPMTDPELAGECGVGRRCIQKGLKQLEQIAEANANGDPQLSPKIERQRSKGRRDIILLFDLAGRAETPADRPKPKPQSKTNATTPLPPPVGAAAMMSPDQAVAAAAAALKRSLEPLEDSQPLTPEEMAAFRAQIAAAAAPRKRHLFQQPATRAKPDHGIPTDPAGP